jgi:hypothetical protein
MLSDDDVEEGVVNCEDADVGRIEVEVIVEVEKAYVLEMAAAQTAMVRAENFMVVVFLDIVAVAGDTNYDFLEIN